MIRRIVIVGSGNLAEALARAVAACPDLGLVQLFARNPQRGREVARIAAVPWCSDPAHLAEADLYLLAVSDRAVGALSGALPFPAGAIVAHTAGSVSLDALSTAVARRGVFYPLQTFTKGRSVDFASIPIFVEAGDAATLAEMEAFAGALSRRVIRADSALRSEVHLAAVFACNFVNAMYAAGERIVRAAGADFDVLKPLIAETAAKALDAAAPADVQTGPAVRGDLPTQERHERMLAGEEELRTLYRMISQYIWETSRKI